MKFLTYFSFLFHYNSSQFTKAILEKARKIFLLIFICMSTRLFYFSYIQRMWEGRSKLVYLKKGGARMTKPNLMKCSISCIMITWPCVCVCLWKLCHHRGGGHGAWLPWSAVDQIIVWNSTISSNAHLVVCMVSDVEIFFQINMSSGVGKSKIFVKMSKLNPWPGSLVFFIPCNAATSKC